MILLWKTQFLAIFPFQCQEQERKKKRKCYIKTLPIIIAGLVLRAQELRQKVKSFFSHWVKRCQRAVDCRTRSVKAFLPWPSCPSRRTRWWGCCCSGRIARRTPTPCGSRPVGAKFSDYSRIKHSIIHIIHSFWITEPDLDGVLAHSQGVPQLDGFIPGAGHDLTVIRRESHAQDIFGVADKAASRRATGGMKRMSKHEQKNNSISHKGKVLTKLHDKSLHFVVSQEHDELRLS